MESLDVPTEQIRQVREAVVLSEDPDGAFLEIQGPAAASYLQRMITNEVVKQPLLEGRYNALLDRKGMVLSFFYLVRLREERFLAVGAAAALRRLHEVLNRLKFREMVEIKLDPAWSRLALIGPRAEDAVRKIWKVPDPPHRISEEAGLLVWRDGVYHTPVIFIAGPQDAIRSFQESFGSLPEVARVGRVAGVAGVAQFKRPILKLLQMEAGLPEFGVDIDEHHILLEAAVPYAYQRGKGCYPGQEVVERILAYGKGRAPRSLCTLILETQVAVTAGTEVVTQDGTKAGFVTSSLRDPLANRTLIMATLEHKYLERVDSLTIQSRPVKAFPSTTVLSGP